MPAPTMDWLPAPEAWPETIRAIERLEAPGDDEAWAMLRAAAGTRLDFLRVERLDRSLRRLFAAPQPGRPAGPARLAILGSSTTTHLAAGIRVAGLRRDLHVTTYEPDYGQYRQELMDPGSGLHRFAPNAVLLALDTRHLLAGADPELTSAQAEEALRAIVKDLRALWRQARERFGASIIQQTALPLFPALLGSNEDRLPGSGAAMALRLNLMLRDVAREEGVAVLALDAAAARDGLAAWHDRSLWHRAKQEVSPLAAAMYGDLVARLLAAAQGRSAKCLVLDLDNTVWGGVIGDDGIDGIVLGQGSALGEAFVDVQRHAAALARRGVILAICSKNDEANAIAAFDGHPEMVLKRSDVAAFVANWDDKASNLREIARQLDIGLESLVFVDDNPFERALVRRELPMVAVPELPEDPALYVDRIGDGGYFEALTVTDEDRARCGHYRANRARQSERVGATDLASYLESLEMRLIWRRFDRAGLQRITQLINKTNQFNLTSVRMTEDEVAAVMDDPDAVGLQFRLVDRFGDNGVIAVVIGRLDGAERLMIETWLMSCRVLGRRVEEATLEIVAAEAARLGAREIVGIHRPTAKNGMVLDHYAKLGFIPSAARTEQAGACHLLDLDGYVPARTPIAVTQG